MLHVKGSTSCLWNFGKNQMFEGIRPDLPVLMETLLCLRHDIYWRVKYNSLRSTRGLWPCPHMYYTFFLHLIWKRLGAMFLDPMWLYKVSDLLGFSLLDTVCTRALITISYLMVIKNLYCIKTPRKIFPKFYSFTVVVYQRVT